MDVIFAWGVPLKPLASPSWPPSVPKWDFEAFFSAPGCHLGCLWAPCWHPVRQVFTFFGYCFFKYFPSGRFDHFWVEKGAKMDPSREGGHAICPCLRMFYEGQPIRQKVTSKAVLGHHCGYFGSTLGALWAHFAHFGASLGQPIPAQRLHGDSLRF